MKQLEQDQDPDKIVHIPKEAGTYTIIILVSSEKNVIIGKLGLQKLRSGYYSYTGSALGKGAVSLGERVRRHLRREKKHRWHIDYLLSIDDVKVVAVAAIYTYGKIECEINRQIRDELQAEILILGFGSSDCREKCGSHLLYLGNGKDVISKITGLYSEKSMGKHMFLSTENFTA